ncbi:MAG: hypothetical protein EZS28_036493 [Streblomastix strix]|uniref:Uncharacterized protein n=1 Tax=Streblomastix strix TaxID=222440 RepID=A0A5J4UBQ8_9EUKA|nr:MAG: hypothetical protein EZS28_036493 [Streblomastix strix]
MSNVYIDERLLDAAGLSDFPELYAYIKERYPKPIGELPQPVPIGDQTLQQQVKNNDDIIYASNEEFEPPVANAITKLDLSSQLERNSFLASSGSDPQLIVYGDRITLTASYATTGVFPNGYLFKSYPQETRPKQGDQVIALVGTDASNTYNIFCYIDQGGPFIISSRWLPSNTALVLNITYYKNYESSKKINYDANNDGKIDIMDTWNVNGNGKFEAQSFGAKLAQQGANYEAQQTEFSAMCLFKDMYDKSLAVQVTVSGQLNTLDCEFQGTYILDNYTNEPASNEASNEAQTFTICRQYRIRNTTNFLRSAIQTFRFEIQIEYAYSASAIINDIERIIS